jgi:hypothetical protein
MKDPISKYLTLVEFCTCTNTYKLFAQKINPYPQQEESIQAIKNLNQYLIDPIIEHFGWENFQLTYGFCSPDLKKYLQRKNEKTGQKYGRVEPSRDQHMACEKNTKGNYYCSRLGAACDFFIINQTSDLVLTWIIKQQLPYDRIYYYGKTRPIHISYGPENTGYICTFNTQGVPTKKGLEFLKDLV